jgi:hypothetical protein
MRFTRKKGKIQNAVNTYYKKRKEFHYYKQVKSMLSKHTFSSIIDVGSRKSPVMEKIEGNVYKAMLDIKPIEPIPGIHMITADFYTWTPDRKYDVALCLQVLEHLDKPKEFVKKLFETAPYVLISVPYKWPKGSCKYHLQDPIDEKKIFSWTEKTPIEKHIITDNGKRRMICLYHRNHAALTFKSILNL